MSESCRAMFGWKGSKKLRRSAQLKPLKLQPATCQENMWTEAWAGEALCSVLSCLLTNVASTVLTQSHFVAQELTKQASDYKQAYSQARLQSSHMSCLQEAVEANGSQPYKDSGTIFPTHTFQRVAGGGLGELGAPQTGLTHLSPTQCQSNKP